MKIKEMMPDKAKIVFVIVEKLGIPTLLCLVFMYVYFVTVQKFIEDQAVFRGETKLVLGLIKADQEEIKREVRRAGWSRGR